jgi:hypothetical protein
LTLKFRSLSTALCCLILTGCSDSPPIEAAPEIAAGEFRAFFCGHTEDFRYVQAEIDLRTSAGFTANLAREYRTNARRDAWCEPFGVSGTGG